MPELPEVETTRRGIEPLVRGRRIVGLVVRNPRLRWRVPALLEAKLTGRTIQAVTRRAKYLLLATETGTLILHLGMSGSLRVLPATDPAGKFDHVDIVLDDGQCLRLRDPRRFGAVLWTRAAPAAHRLLAHLGPEPFDPAFTGAYLHQISRHRTRAIRDFLLDARIVAGVGNIYANEALHAAGVRPARAVGRLTLAECDRIVRALRTTLRRAIRAGGTTLRDFRASDGNPGYFQLALKVYGREGAPCPRCRSPIRLRRLGNRSAFYCPKCQA